MEGTIEVNGVVLSSMPVGEYDRRLLLLTKEKGKISAFARGARKPGSPLLAASRPCTFGTYRIYEGRNSYTIQGMTPIRYFEELAQDLAGMAYASYCLELADYYAREGVDGTDMMNLLFVTFKALLKGQMDPALIRRVYELRLMGINGEGPQVFVCGSCGTPLTSGLYSKRKGSLYCRDCDRNQPETAFLSEGVVYTLQYILTAPLPKLFAFSLAEPVLGQVSRITQQHLKRHIEKEFHSLTVLDAITT